MPDFGIFRGFNEKLFGDKLVAGQLPTQLGLIGSEDFGFDPDASAFFERVDTAGGTLSDTEKEAVNQLVLDMKANGIWSSMKAIYPMVGASSAACAQNLKSSSFTGTFNGGWTFASTGATPNGSSGYMDTYLNPSDELTQNNISIGIYSGTSTVNSSAALGAFRGGTFLRLYPGFSSSLIIAELNDGGSTVTNSENRADGFVFAYRTTTPNFVISRRGTQVNVSNATNGTVDANIFLGAANDNGTPSSYSPFEHRLTFIGEGLTDTEASDFYTAVQAFNTTLSREV